VAVEDRLRTRLEGVDGVTADDIAAWTAEAEDESGLKEGEDDTALLYMALAVAYETLATRAAQYFVYKDGDEMVDKSRLYNNYMRLALNARRNYRKTLRARRGAGQSHAGRADLR